MIFKRLHRTTPEQEQRFARQMAHSDWKEKLAMILGAYVTILLPCAAVLSAFAGLIFFLMGVFF